MRTDRLKPRHKQTSNDEPKQTEQTQNCFACSCTALNVCAATVTFSWTRCTWALIMLSNSCWTLQHETAGQTATVKKQLCNTCNCSESRQVTVSVRHLEQLKLCWIVWGWDTSMESKTSLAACCSIYMGIGNVIRVANNYFLCKDVVGKWRPEQRMKPQFISVNEAALFLTNCSWSRSMFKWISSSNDYMQFVGMYWNEEESHYLATSLSLALGEVLRRHRLPLAKPQRHRLLRDR